MDVYTIDFETFWSTDYSVSKMSPLEYVLGDQYETISCSIKRNDEPTEVYFGDEVEDALSRIDWPQVAACGHNMSGFDAYILAYRYKAHPKLWLCTAAMARPIHAKTTGASLAALVKHYGLGVKDNAVLLQTKGRHLADFTPGEIDAMRVYNKADTDQCRALFKILSKHYNSAELWQIDALTRMRTEPAFVVDVNLLEHAACYERDRKRLALREAATLLGLESEANMEEEVRSQLASAPKFAALLTKLDVEVPMKPSPTNPDKEVPALAKTDEAFLALQEHDNPVVAAAARTRLDVKSTLLETRIQKFLTAARLTGGRLPVPLKYCGADTTGRDSGEEYNCQNLPRITPGERKASDALRNSLRAPRGYKVIVADQSGIELRVNHFLWQVPSSMALYRESPDKADLYKDFASRLYGVDVDEVTKPQRQIGKVAHLGLGFGAGPAAFKRVAKTMGGIDLADHEAMSITYAWREEYAQIVDGWRTCHAALPLIEAGVEQAVDPWGLVRTCAEGFRLPSGRLIRYPDLRQEIAEGDGNKKEWVYAHGRHKARIYAGKVTENLVQALARDSIFDCALEFFRQTGLRPALRVHDELVYVVPAAEAERQLATLQDILRTPPRWWPELVVWSEGDVADTYGSAK